MSKITLDLLSDTFPGGTSAGALGLSSSVLVRAENRKMVFDTGLHGVAGIVLANLKKLSVTPQEIDTVFLSHLHFDHVNNLQLYPNAEILVGKTEWESALANRDPYTPVESLYYIRDYRKFRLIEGDRKEILPGVTSLLTPGHSPGHCSLLMEVDGKRVVLAGDAVKNRVELQNERSDLCMDGAAATASIRRIKALADRVLPGHDGWVEIIAGAVRPMEEKSLTIRLPAGYGAAEKPVEWIITTNIS
jgi:glyoxylase-like metal-dependent hydrolase (beta-lactamase superfamily II)